MKTEFAAVLAALCLSASLPLHASAHEGIVHESCPADQTFTAGGLEISGAFTRATLPAAKVAGGYLTVENRGTIPDRLLGGTSEAVESVQVHQMKIEGDVMKMGRAEGGLEIPAGEAVTLAPGGYHLMMIGLRNPLVEGECVEVTLQFEQAGEVPVMLNVGGMAADAAPEGHAHH
jgi:copper(I)-binding protein